MHTLSNRVVGLSVERDSRWATPEPPEQYVLGLPDGGGVKALQILRQQRSSSSAAGAELGEGVAQL